MGRDVDRVSPTRDPLATAVLMLFIGLIMVVMGAGALSVVVIFAGVMLMVYGSSSISRGIRSNSNADMILGVVMAVVGLLLVIATGRMTSILIIVMALFLMALGVLDRGRGPAGVSWGDDRDDDDNHRRRADRGVAAEPVLIHALNFVTWVSSETLPRIRR